MSATMIDVARRAGVSVGTVSNVVRGTRPVSESTRSQVLRAMDDLGYRPNAVAGALKRGATHTLGFVFTDLLNPYYSILALAVERRAREAGYSVLLANSDGDPELEAAHVRAFVERRVDGVVIPSMTEHSNIAEELLERNIPTVCVGFSDNDPRLGAVDCDEEDAMAQVADHLLELGHDRIAFLYQETRDHAVDRRPAALRSALREHGVELVDPDDEPTAICCSNDVVAIDLMHDVLSQGGSIPGDISIVGFDDIPMAGHPRIGLTTVHFDAEHTGEVVIERLLHAVQESRHVSQLVTLPATLTVRATTGPPPPASGGRRRSRATHKPPRHGAR
jgi:LacI family transcriptional regulator